jgi:hypothetical protein
MKSCKCMLAVAGSLLLMFFAMDAPREGFAQNVDGNLENQPGVDVQTRGPIHDAFAQPALPKPTAAPVVPKRPPEPVNELPPDQKPEGNQVQWLPGYWTWDDDRNDFLWVSGVWRVPPPGRQWVPGYWQPADGGWRWISGYWGVQAENQVSLLPPPPDPVEEAIPPQPNADSLFIPGIYVYQENRYWWRPGHWIGFRPGWVWTPAHYSWTPGGYIFVRGYWDHDLAHRGICFAPVILDPRVYVRAGWFYRPHFTIAADFFLGSFFVRVGVPHYYFGDYYDPLYARRGFTPWVDYHFRGNLYDPLFSYYRWEHRGDQRWEKDLRATYTLRRENVALRPPRTLALQARADAKLRVVAPVTQWRAPEFKMETVSKAHIEEIHKNTQEWRDLSKQRGKIEMEVKPIAKKAEFQKEVKIELPKTAIVHPVPKIAPPPHPEQPKLQPKPGPPKKEKASLPVVGNSVAWQMETPRVLAITANVGRRGFVSAQRRFAKTLG